MDPRRDKLQPRLEAIIRVEKVTGINSSTLHYCQQILKANSRAFGNSLEDEGEIPISVEFPCLYVEISHYILYLEISFELQIHHICLESLLAQLFTVEFSVQFALPMPLSVHMLVYDVLERLVSGTDEEWILVILRPFEYAFDLLLSVCFRLFSRQYLPQFCPFCSVRIGLQPNLAIPELFIQSNLLNKCIDQPSGFAFVDGWRIWWWSFRNILLTQCLQLLQDVSRLILPETHILMRVHTTAYSLSVENLLLGFNLLWLFVDCRSVSRRSCGCSLFCPVALHRFESILFGFLDSLLNFSHLAIKLFGQAPFISLSTGLQILSVGAYWLVIFLQTGMEMSLFNHLLGPG